MSNSEPNDKNSKNSDSKPVLLIEKVPFLNENDFCNEDFNDKMICLIDSILGDFTKHSFTPINVLVFMVLLNNTISMRIQEFCPSIHLYFVQSVINEGLIFNHLTQAFNDLASKKKMAINDSTPIEDILKHFFAMQLTQSTKPGVN